MAELTPAAETTAADPCCATEQQATCCEPSAKAECCDSSHGEGCGCSAGTTDIRETVRERYAAAVQVTTTTDPGADVDIRETHRVHAQAASAIVRARKPIEPPA